MRIAQRHIGPVWVALLVLATGCPHDSDTKPKRKVSTVRVRSYTEATAVNGVASVLPYAFTATARGLDRWDLRTGKGLLLTADHGLPGDRVMAIALDRGRGWLWVATDGGVIRYDLDAGVFTGIPPAPTDALTAVVADVRALAPAGTGGVWIGSAEGLTYTDSDGGWKAGGYDGPVTSLMRDGNGDLWIGTESKGLVVRRADGAFQSFDKDESCAVRSVRFVAQGPDGAAIAVGEDVMGKQRIAIVRDGMCASFRASPETPWLAAAQVGDELVVMTKRRLYALFTAHRGARRLRRDGMRLVPLAPGTDTERSRINYGVRSLDARVPVGAGSIAPAGDKLLIGTRDLGTAVVDASGNGVTWLRRGELVGGGQDMSVACTGRKRCYVATGGHGLWRFDGATFRRVGDGEAVVLAVARSPRNGVHVLYRLSDEARVRIARVDGGQWTEHENIRIETPGRRAALTFAKISPRGPLWVGLSYIDEDGEERAYGAAEIDIGLELVAYHRASYDAGDAERGVLPIPIDITDADFHGGDEVWLSSNEGVARVQGQEILVFGESEGLVSELVRSIAVTSGGVVFAATGAGVGVYDGEHWSNPAPLRRSVNAVAVGSSGQLWMATPRGVAAYDGARVRRLDKRRGLLEDDISDLVIDRYGRIWALSQQGISIVTP
jgi:hypothetical protein